MLDIALKFLRDELRSYIVARTASTLVDVKLSKMVDEAGKYAFLEDNIGLSLINIEEERTLKEQLPRYNLNTSSFVHEPELKLNLHIMLAANFRQYDMALMYLSHILTYFQSHPVFTSEKYPGLDSRISKLVLELQSLSYEQLNQIWASVGGKQLPCMIYKVRMVVLQDTEPAGIKVPITTIATTTENK